MVTDCLYIMGIAQYSKVYYVCKKRKFCVFKDKKSLINMSTNEISHYTDERSLQIPAVFRSRVDNGKFHSSVKR